MMVCYGLFFFFKQKTAYEMRISDWSSDVCSSDLGSRMGAGVPEYLLIFRKPPTDRSNGYADVPVVKDKEAFTRGRWQFDAHGFTRSNGKIGRASCRERVCQYV